MRDVWPPRPERWAPMQNLDATYVQDKWPIGWWRYAEVSFIHGPGVRQLFRGTHFFLSSIFQRKNVFWYLHSFNKWRNLEMFFFITVVLQGVSLSSNEGTRKKSAVKRYTWTQNWHLRTARSQRDSRNEVVTHSSSRFLNLPLGLRPQIFTKIFLTASPRPPVVVPVGYSHVLSASRGPLFHSIHLVYVYPVNDG